MVEQRIIELSIPIENGALFMVGFTQRCVDIGDYDLKLLDQANMVPTMWEQK